MIAVCGIGNPKGLRNSATTAYQSARPPMVAASANAATKPNTGCTGTSHLATTNSASVPASTSVASALTRRSSAARAASPGASNEKLEGSVMKAFGAGHSVDRRYRLRRHPEVRALSCAPRRMTAGTAWRRILRGSPKRLAPQDDGTSKRRPAEAGLECVAVSRSRSGGLAVGRDLGQVVLGGPGTIGDQLAEIFGGRLRPRHQHFAARTDHVGLDLDRLVERLGGGQPVDAGEEGFGVLVDRLLDVAADLGGLADRTGHGGLDRGGHLFRIGMQVGGAVLGGRSGALDEVTGSFGNFQVLERVGDGCEGFLDGIQHGIGFGRGFGGHGVSPSSGLSYVTPSALARGRRVVTQLMVRRNINVAVRYHELVIYCRRERARPFLCMGSFSIFLFRAPWPPRLTCDGSPRRSGWHSLPGSGSAFLATSRTPATSPQSGC